MKRHAATERLLFHSKRWPFFDSLNSLLAPRTHDDNRAAPNFNQSAVVSGHSLRSVPDTPATLSPDCGFAEAGADAVRLPALISAHASDRARSKGGEHVLHRSLHGCSRARRVRGALSDRHLFIQRHDACAPIARQERRLAHRGAVLQQSQGLSSSGLTISSVSRWLADLYGHMSFSIRFSVSSMPF
mgnify:CR=1 FL=1